MLRRFDELVKCDKEGVLKGAREVIEEKPLVEHRVNLIHVLLENTFHFCYNETGQSAVKHEVKDDRKHST